MAPSGATTLILAAPAILAALSLGAAMLAVRGRGRARIGWAACALLAGGGALLVLGSFFAASP